ncbi:DUF2975 domain-containing protein [Flavobacterium alkalisoli]|uniref:DUF2975 domain-containing protein n=1 Tax=Flavobacterium alkalisoli TaxID=2602769 RepID=UPI003A8F32C1
MKRLSALKTITDILFVLAVIPAIFGLPFILMTAIMPERIPFKLNGDEFATINGAELIISLLVIYLSYALAVYALYLFKKVLESFKKKRFFDEVVILSFNQMGKALLLSWTIGILPSLYYNLVDGSIKISIGFSDSLFTLGLGFFFIVLSDVFLMAKKQKEENDLTI